MYIFLNKNILELDSAVSNTDSENSGLNRSLFLSYIKEAQR